MKRGLAQLIHWQLQWQFNNCLLCSCGDRCDALWVDLFSLFVPLCDLYLITQSHVHSSCLFHSSSTTTNDDDDDDDDIAEWFSVRENDSYCCLFMFRWASFTWSHLWFINFIACSLTKKDNTRERTPCGILSLVFFSFEQLGWSCLPNQLKSKIKPCSVLEQDRCGPNLRTAHYISCHLLEGHFTRRIPVVILELIRAKSGLFY